MDRRACGIRIITMTPTVVVSMMMMMMIMMSIPIPVTNVLEVFITRTEMGPATQGVRIAWLNQGLPFWPVTGGFTVSSGTV